MIDEKAFFKIGYGLYVLTTLNDDKANGCIVNTFAQVTSTPQQVTVAVNKQNLTCEMIKTSNKFNVSVISESASFELFKRFGFQTGHTADKFADFPCPTTENGIAYITEGVNAIFSCEVKSQVDLGTHILFIAEVKSAMVLNETPSATYTYYQSNIKPKPAKTKVKGWRCTVCGYIHESDELPPDFICPICKHDASVFEKIE